MKKIFPLIGLAMVASASVSAVEVTGKAPLSLGFDAARAEAVNTALLEASHRNNVYVSGVTEVDNLEVTNERSIVRTSSLITSMDILDVIECEDYLCVTIDVEFGEDVKPVVPEKEQNVHVIFSFTGAMQMGYIESFAKVKEQLLSSINGSKGYYVTDDQSKADVIAVYKFTLEEVESSFLSFFEGDRLAVSGTLSVANSMSLVAKEFDLEDQVYRLPKDNDFNELGLNLSKKFISTVVDLPADTSFQIVNSVGNTLFLNSKTMRIGSVFEVVYLDNQTNEQVVLSAVVKEAFNGLVSLKLNREPSSAWRIIRIVKVAM